MSAACENRILIANEPRSYREALAAALQIARPGLDVSLADPRDLDQEVLRCSAALVICSELSATVERRIQTWVVLYPEGTRLVMTSEDSVSTVSDLDLPTLLGIIDRAVGSIPA